MIVMKFGGTSVQDAAAIRQANEIVASRAGRHPVVVVSAMAGVTNALLEIASAAKAGRFDEAAAAIAGLRQRHASTATDLLAVRHSDSGPKIQEAPTADQVLVAIDRHFSELEGLTTSIATLGELSPRSRDAYVSFGERLSSLIVTAALRRRGLPARLIDARAFVITDDQFTNAIPNTQETEKRARAALPPLLEAGTIPITQGFIGSTLEGITTTIGRGGSDYSASILGAALEAESIEIWTDVDGMMTADPRIVPEARRIRVISFAEAAELAYFGARVLHPSTVLPAVERGIPVHIYNTRNPECEGTLIVSEARASRNLIKSIAFKRGVTIVNVTSTRMLMAYGFLRAIFEVFDRHQTPVDVVTTSEVSVSMTVDSANGAESRKLDSIKKDLGGIGDVSVERGKAIVCVVGDNLKFTPGVAARLFRAIEKTNINMISQGASEINVTFVIDEEAVESVVRALHAAFFEETDPEVFA
jgi:aspartate kinase